MRYSNQKRLLWFERWTRRLSWFFLFNGVVWVLVSLDSLFDFISSFGYDPTPDQNLEFIVNNMDSVIILFVVFVGFQALSRLIKYLLSLLNDLERTLAVDQN
jgi:hypothetical protein